VAMIPPFGLNARGCPCSGRGPSQRDRFRSQRLQEFRREQQEDASPVRPGEAFFVGSVSGKGRVTRLGVIQLTFP